VSEVSDTQQMFDIVKIVILSTISLDFGLKVIKMKAGLSKNTGVSHLRPQGSLREVPSPPLYNLPQFLL
jgi:hypothetical protein